MVNTTVCPVHNFPPPSKILVSYQPFRHKVMTGQKSIYKTFLGQTSCRHPLPESLDELHQDEPHQGKLTEHGSRSLWQGKPGYVWPAIGLYAPDQVKNMGSDIRSMSSIEPICKCRCPPLCWIDYPGKASGDLNMGHCFLLPYISGSYSTYCFDKKKD